MNGKRNGMLYSIAFKLRPYRVDWSFSNETVDDYSSDRNNGKLDILLKTGPAAGHEADAILNVMFNCYSILNGPNDMAHVPHALQLSKTVI